MFGLTSGEASANKPAFALSFLASIYVEFFEHFVKDGSVNVQFGGSGGYVAVVSIERLLELDFFKIVHQPAFGLFIGQAEQVHRVSQRC